MLTVVKGKRLDELNRWKTCTLECEGKVEEREKLEMAMSEMIGVRGFISPKTKGFFYLSIHNFLSTHT